MSKEERLPTCTTTERCVCEVQTARCTRRASTSPRWTFKLHVLPPSPHPRPMVDCARRCWSPPRSPCRETGKHVATAVLGVGDTWVCGRTRIGSLLVSSWQCNGTQRCTSARRRGDSKRYERQPRLHLLCAPGSHRYDTLTLSPSHPTTHHPVDRRACASASQSASGAKLAGASTLVGTLHARSAQWINRIQLHVITITHNRHMPCPPSGRTPQRHLGGWWRIILRESPVNSAFLVTEVLHRSYALFSPAHLAVASIRTLR